MAECLECGEEVTPEEKVKNREGAFHGECLEDHLDDLAAEQRKAEHRAAREARRSEKE